MITGAERGVVTFAACCHPIPGDEIMGFLSAGKGMVVHQVACPNVPEFRRNPERWVAIDWDRNVQGDFRARCEIVVDNRPGVLATSRPRDRRGRIEHRERRVPGARRCRRGRCCSPSRSPTAEHLAEVMRRVRRSSVVHAVSRAAG